MKILIGFLVIAFILGGIEARRDRPTRPLLLLGMSVLATGLLSLARFV